ncbi:hypothetical protein KCP73_15355 [Salmonella enterica subsp. enterica]|nr:hypothetical protein KCP73_15355 [Salmonella enterica subsp. enterica]
MPVDVGGMGNQRRVKFRLPPQRKTPAFTGLRSERRQCRDWMRRRYIAAPLPSRHAAFIRFVVTTLHPDPRGSRDV